MWPLVCYCFCGGRNRHGVDIWGNAALAFSALGLGNHPVACIPPSQSAFLSLCTVSNVNTQGLELKVNSSNRVISKK